MIFENSLEWSFPQISSFLLQKPQSNVTQILDK